MGLIMLADTVIYLLFISIISLLKIRIGLDKIIIPAISIAVAFVFYLFCSNWSVAPDTIVTLLWDSSRSGDIKIDIVSSNSTYLLVFPFFVITITALFNNLFFRYETKKRNFAAILILNLLSLIMLISGNNLIQIITFVFVIDILSQLFIKDVYASRRYSIYNLVADMGLFLIMAMLKGKLESLEISSITHYYETGRHRDFIMFVVMISLFIKFGFFLFQSYLLDLKNTKFHRLILIPYLSTPMVALILFMKFYPLLIVSPSFETCLDIAVTLTMLWGTLGMIVINNLKEKTVYLNMLIISSIVKLVQLSNFIWNINFSLMLIAGFYLNVCLFYTHYYIYRENIASPKNNSCILKYIIIIYMLIAMSFISQLNIIYNEQNRYWIYLFVCLFTVGSAHLFSQILFGINASTKYSMIDVRPFPILFFCLISSIFIILLYKSYYISYAAFAVTFLVLIKSYPLRVISENLIINQRLQKIDFFARIYDIIIVHPVKIIGRWLTVLFDFVFIEKTLATMVASINNLTIRLFRKSVRHWSLYYLANFIIAVLLLVYCLLKGNK